MFYFITITANNFHFSKCINVIETRVSNLKRTKGETIRAITIFLSLKGPAMWSYMFCRIIKTPWICRPDLTPKVYNSFSLMLSRPTYLFNVRLPLAKRIYYLNWLHGTCTVCFIQDHNKWQGKCYISTLYITYLKTYSQRSTSLV